MKKYLSIFVILALAAVSCGKEDTLPEENKPQEQENDGGGKVTLSLNVSSTATRTYVSDVATGAITWEAGDEIGVFTELDAEPIRFTMSGDPGTSATFTGEVSEGATELYAFYPYNSSATFAEGKITTSLPSEQTFGTHNTVKGAMVAVGTGVETAGVWSVTLKNAFSYIQFKITSSDVNEIVLNAGSDKLAGTASFSVSDASISGTGTASSITARTASGYFDNDTYYYLPVLPGTVSELKFSMTSHAHGAGSGTDGFDDWKAERTVASSLTFAQNLGKKFDSLDSDGSTNKWSWYFDIHDYASLERFRALVGAGNFPDGGVAKFTSDIDLSGKTLAAEAGTFTGTLDGQSHSITNWTANGVALFSAVGRDGGSPADGLVKDFTIAPSCTLTFSFTNPGNRAGFVARVLNNHGTVDGITNNATVTPVTGAVTGMYAGIIAGVSYGLIQNCVNNSDISITATSMTGNVYMGGIVGYVNYGSNLTLDHCTNNGNISYRVNNTAKQIFLGGISGGTSISKASALSMRGIIDSCLNTGNVTYVLTNGGSLNDNEGTDGSGNYIKVGGLVGYFDGNVTNCINGVEGNSEKGIVSVTAPTNESSACVTGVSVGGIAAYVSQNVTGCANYGKVYFKGTMAGGTNDASGAGVKSDPEFGGIVAQVGPPSGGGSYAVNDCHNYGPMEIHSWMATGNGSWMYFGGIAGYAKVPVTSCSNDGVLTIDTKAARNFAGGVAGHVEIDGSNNLTNNGGIDLTFNRSTGGDPSTYKQCAGGFHTIGGVMGYASNGLSNSTNNGDITVTGSSNAGVSCPLVGGVTGWASSSFASNVNTGDIVVDHPTDGANGLRVGGLIGHCDGFDMSGTCYNTGSIDVTGGTLSTGILMVGGAIGYMESAATTPTMLESRYDALNPKPIAVNVTVMNNQVFIAGVIAYINGTTAKTRSALKNYKPINVDLGTTTTNGYFSYIAGISSNDKANQTFSNCENHGNIDVVAPHKTRLAGIASYTNQTTSNCIVDCDITADLCEKNYSEVGGIIGYTAATGFTGCSFSGTLDTSASSSSLYTGGILGKSNGNQTFNGCSVSGALSANVNAPGLYVGGLENNGIAITFGASTKCTVGAGTTLNGDAVASLTNDNLVSQSSNTGTYTSTSTRTNIAIE